MLLLTAVTDPAFMLLYCCEVTVVDATSAFALQVRSHQFSTMHGCQCCYPVAWIGLRSFGSPHHTRTLNSKQLGRVLLMRR